MPIPVPNRAIVLQTRHGKNKYDECAAAFNVVRGDRDSMTALRGVLETDRNKLDRRLSHFLRDEKQAKKYKMDEVDKLGWKMYKELSDEHSVLSYFIRRLK